MEQMANVFIGKHIDYILAKKYGRVFIMCKLKNPHIYEVQWYRNFKTIEMPPPYPFTWKWGGILMVRPLVPGKTDGYYECAAALDGRQHFLKGINITILPERDLPKEFSVILRHPQTMLNPRTDITFYCSVKATGLIQILLLFS